MSTAEATELTDVLNRVSTWPTTLQFTLGHKVLSWPFGCFTINALQHRTTRRRRT
jgi:hypothetical protein